MRTIEISTTQNVIIQYQLASAIERSIAFILDAVIIFFFFLLIVSIFNNDVVLTIILLSIGFYSLVSEVLMDGQTLGKKIIGIRVIKEDGTQPDFSNFFNRWALRLLDIWLSLGVIAIISIIGSKKGQRYGDKSGETILVKKRTDITYSLDNLLELNKQTNYKITYPQVTLLNEMDVIALKRLLIRFSKNKQNNKTKTLLANTKYALEDKLGLKSKENNNYDFIKIIVKDYVMLTR